MGAHPYYYFVPYQEDVQAALDSLREREFRAGRYNPVMQFISFEPEVLFEQAPGAEHDSIEEAMEAAMEDGTRSILDIGQVGQQRDYCTAAPLQRKEILQFFGTDKPTREQVRNCDELFESIGRGTCIYTTVYEAGVPKELFFAGYSFD